MAKWEGLSNNTNTHWTAIWIFISLKCSGGRSYLRWGKFIPDYLTLKHKYQNRKSRKILEHFFYQETLCLSKSNHNYSYNSETENKDTTTAYCFWVKLKVQYICLLHVNFFYICYFKFSFMKKKMIIVFKQHIKGKIKYELKQTNSSAVQKLQQIIVRLEKI